MAPNQKFSAKALADVFIMLLQIDGGKRRGILLPCTLRALYVDSTVICFEIIWSSLVRFVTGHDPLVQSVSSIAWVFECRVSIIICGNYYRQSRVVRLLGRKSYNSYIASRLLPYDVLHNLAQWARHLLVTL